jgi:hypothetical protein
MQKQYRKDAVIIFCLLAFVFAYFYQDGGWNANSRFGLIFAMVQERRLTIDSFHNTWNTVTNDKAYYNGHFYSDKAIGPSLAGAVIYLPFYWIKLIFHRIIQDTAKVILTFLVIGVPSAFAGSLMYILCLYLSKSRFLSYLVTLTIALGTLYLPYSVVFFSHQFTSSLLFSAFVMIFFLKEKPELGKNWYLFVIGSLMGWALISEFPSVMIILALIFYYFSIVWKNQAFRHLRSIFLPLAGGSIPVILQLLYNKLCFDNFFSIGYANLNDQYFSSAMGQGIMGIHWPNLSNLYFMTLHPTLGLFWESPVLLLSILGASVLLFKHTYRTEAILAAWIIGSYLFIMSGYYMWWGGGAVGPRHIIPVLPFFCIFLVFVPKRFTGLFVILSTVSIAQMMIAAASTVLVPDSLVSDLKTMGFFDYSNIYSFELNELLKGNFTQNLGSRFLGLNSWSSFIPLFPVIAVITLFFFTNNQKISLRRN